MVARKKRIQPDTYICKRCHTEITDRSPKRFSIIELCLKCVREKEKIKCHTIYRRHHPKKPLKREIIIKRLQKSPATEPELIKLSKSKNSVALRALITKLRTKGYIIQAVHFMPCHYVLVNPK